MKILGLKVVGHDTGAALLYEDKIVAISQERLDRKKYSGAFPSESIDYCISATGLQDIKEIDFLAVEQPDIKSYRIEKLLEKHGLWPKLKNKTFFVGHHDAHAASAFFCSPFENAAVMVVDNAGSTVRLENGLSVVETESFYEGTGNKLKLIKRHYSPVNKYTGGVIDSSGIGYFHAQITRFLGFGKLEDGKTMGLAPYGDEKLINEIPVEQFLKKTEEGRYILPAPLDDKHPQYNLKYLFKRGDYSRLRGFKELFKKIIYLPSNISFKHKPQFKIKPYIFSYNKRPKSTTLPDIFYTSIAYWGQYWLEKVMVDYAKDIYNVTKSKNLSMAGGVALNSVANKKILDQTQFADIFIQPASGDSGLPLGAALWVKHQIKDKPIDWRMKNAYLGRAYSDKEIEKALQEENYEKIDNPAKIAARLISEGKIIGWVQGGSEYGPRALGNRSILCSPIPKEMKDKLNAQVKHRESFRPFAPVILEEKTKEYFDLQIPGPYMLLVAKILKDNIPAVTHIDGTGRVQTLTEKQNRLFFNLIKEFEKITNVPVVLNTSFNDNGEPIVESPKDAVKSFHSTNLDALIIGNFLVKK